MNVLARAGVCWLVLACFSMTVESGNRFNVVKTESKGYFAAVLCLTFVIGILCILKDGREIENYFWSSEFRCCFICILFHMEMKL